MPTSKKPNTVNVVELVAQLRTWASGRDTDAYAIDGAFDQFGVEVEAAAAAARPLVQEAASAVFQLVLALERTPEYKRQVKGSGPAHGVPATSAGRT